MVILPVSPPSPSSPSSIDTHTDTLRELSACRSGSAARQRGPAEANGRVMEEEEEANTPRMKIYTNWTNRPNQRSFRARPGDCLIPLNPPPTDKPIKTKESEPEERSRGKFTQYFTLVLSVQTQDRFSIA